MKIVIIALRSTDHSLEEFAPYLDTEAARAFDYMDEGFIREIYSIPDSKGAIIIAETESEEAARTKMAKLPLVKAGMMNLEFYPTMPYRAFKQAADHLRSKN